jgi:hypothetical protein
MPEPGGRQLGELGEPLAPVLTAAAAITMGKLPQTRLELIEAVPMLTDREPAERSASTVS